VAGDQAGKDERLGLGPRLGKAALDEQLVETPLHGPFIFIAGSRFTFASPFRG
jgi:hypothetical protein